MLQVSLFFRLVFSSCLKLMRADSWPGGMVDGKFLVLTNMNAIEQTRQVSEFLLVAWGVKPFSVMTR